MDFAIYLTSPEFPIRFSFVTPQIFIFDPCPALFHGYSNARKRFLLINSKYSEVIFHKTSSCYRAYLQKPTIYAQPLFARVFYFSSKTLLKKVFQKKSKDCSCVLHAACISLVKSSLLSEKTNL